MTEREKMIKIIQNSVDGCAEHWAGLIADGLLENGVVFQQKGHWVDENSDPVEWDEMNAGCPLRSCCCSACGEWLVGSDEYAVFGKYCPNCGAKMEGENEKRNL